MKKDYRPYWLKQAWYKLLHFHIRHFLSPQLEHLGKNPFIVKPWCIELFGGPIFIGDNVSLLGCPDKKTRLTVWSEKKNVKGIHIGDHVLISPGTRISAANSIIIGDSCMLASNSYITDSDWHGIYDRSMPPYDSTFTKLEENVWIGDSAIVCKGVIIGKNSIIGAGSVVTCDIPPNVIAAGNPAKIIRDLDPKKEIITRKDRFSDIREMNQFLEVSEKQNLAGNTLTGWIRSYFFPKKI
ncbi:MAG: acyltransferase [Desulfobacteraceae bacterium]|nr:acyltransferase [Desulfobacteraceae bacterium]